MTGAVSFFVGEYNARALPIFGMRLFSLFLLLFLVLLSVLYGHHPAHYHFIFR